MKSFLRDSIAASLVSLMVATLNAQELPHNVFAVSLDDEVEDLLFLGDTRPVLIRLHIRVDGEGHRGRWREFVRRTHLKADEDRDGVVDRSEANKAIDRVNLLRSAATVNGRPAPRRQLLIPPPIVSVDDLADQMRTVIQPFMIQRQAPLATANEEGTFRLLDRDGDGQLSWDELAAVATSLARLDRDDDELITAEELGPYRNPIFANVAVAQAPVVANPNPGGAVISTSGLQPRDLARLIMQRYAWKPNPAPVRPVTVASASRDREVRLRAKEFPIDREAFLRIDSDGDGLIDSTELEHAVTDAVDLELIVRLGHRDPGQLAIDHFEGTGVRVPFGAPGIRRVGDLMILELPSTFIEVGTEPDGADPFAATRSGLEARFRAADLDQNGFLDRNEVRRFLPLTSVFDDADRDRDGNLSEAEWHSHLDRQAKVHGLLTVLQDSEQGSSFLDLLDQNRDRKLGCRELLDAPRRILLEDRDGDGRVSIREFSRHHRWTFARGQVTPTAQPPIVVDQRPTRPVGLVSAPEWFLKMDRNRDGDISPREFLGTRATFEEYDTDRDGLIAPSEATRPR